MTWLPQWLRVITNQIDQTQVKGKKYQFCIDVEINKLSLLNLVGTLVTLIVGEI